ncbi:uncharacterized protein GGS22DRAFT_189221 [Annulohypoxylon maeteangense]|uniref:uncharacterized protein n=1 Tax=Annulohypoxylon maeteangense TaxID=1927788 RepID=UPI002008A9B8|nr:uncharacterized protein GGS22DRAFT_189221 [Annulohypoxylon maeteangense]KAI0884091.1 hypothetical protein GGS22DRAFT_189221 [Annulohypoxylon maeteangense]
MATTQVSGMPFVVSTSLDKPDPNLRKFIRKHVMMGKNRGKTRPTKKREKKALELDLSEVADPTIHLTKPPAASNSSLVVTRLPIPPKVGSELSTVHFADDVDLSTVAVVLRFSSIAKQALFPLETCISFDQGDKKQWIEPLAFDAAYLHTMIFTTHDYFNLLLQRAPGGETSTHFFKTIQILRERLLYEGDGRSKVSILTASVVLALAGHALLMNEYVSARHHLEGLRKIIDLRGGLTTFKGSSKLLIEILRCDLGMSLYTGLKPLFSDILLSSGPSLLYPEPLPTSSYCKINNLLEGITDELVTTWTVMEGFCSLINLAAKSKTRIPKEMFLDAMASVMYRLLYMEFAADSTNELLRLALLAFSSSVFLQWKYMRMSYPHFSALYKDCLMKTAVSDIPPQLRLWLLMVGGVSVFTRADEEWLRPWLRAIMNLCDIELWTEMQDILDSFMWIGLVHDELGKEVFDSASLLTITL